MSGFGWLIAGALALVWWGIASGARRAGRGWFVAQMVGGFTAGWLALAGLVVWVFWFA